MSINHEEEKILNDFFENNKMSLESSRQYSDQFYEEYKSQYKINNKNKRCYLLVKRLFDICVSFICIVLLSIPFLIIAIAIKCNSKGPVIFKNRRVGCNGDIFYCWKFRSMYVDTPPEEATSTFKDAKSHITKVGAFLRKTSLDELPQLFNVLFGDMSFIGYRPLVPSEKKCNEMRQQLGVFRFRPGISGYAQVHGRDDVYYKNKAIMDSYYTNNNGIKMDISLMFETVKVILKREGNEDNKCHM